MKFEKVLNLEIYFYKIYLENFIERSKLVENGKETWFVGISALIVDIV